MQSLKGEMQSQMNKPGMEGKTTMIHPGARHDIIEKGFLSLKHGMCHKQGMIS